MHAGNSIELFLDLAEPCFLRRMCSGGRNHVKFFLEDLYGRGITHPALIVNLAILVAIKNIHLKAMFGAAGWGYKASSEEDLELWTLRTTEKILELKIGRPSSEIPDGSLVARIKRLIFATPLSQRDLLLKDVVIPSKDVLRDFLMKMSNAFFDKDYARLIEINRQFENMETDKITILNL